MSHSSLPASCFDEKVRPFSPSPPGVVIPRYWHDGSRFGGAPAAHWSWQKPKRKPGSVALKAKLLATL